MRRTYHERLHKIIDIHIGLNVSLEGDIGLLIDEIVKKESGMVDVDGKKILIGDSLYRKYEGFEKIR